MRPGLPFSLLKHLKRNESVPGYESHYSPFGASCLGESWMIRFRALFHGLIIVILSTTGLLALAQTAPGRSVRISVSDDRNLPVAQATVELRSGDKVVSTSTTDDKGSAHIEIGAAGHYTVVISKDGFLREEYPLEAGPQVPPEMEFVLSLAALSKQSVDVTATAANPVEETAANSQAQLSPATAKDTPERAVTLTDVLPLVPGIVRGPDGTVRIAGYAENHSALLINSVDVTDPATGNFGLSIPIDSVETIAVSEMPYLAQYGRFTAGVVTAETRRGGEKWEWSLNDPLPEFRIRSWDMQGLKSATPRLNLSGPLVARKLYLVEGVEYAIKKQSVYTLPFPYNQTTSRSFNSFTQLDAILSPTQTLTASYHIAPHSIDNEGLNYFNPIPVTPDASIHESTETLLHRWGVGGGVLQSIVAQTHIGSGVTPHGTADMVLTPVGNSGNYYSQESRQASRFEWIENWTSKVIHLKGDHTFQVGSSLATAADDGKFTARPVEIRDGNGALLRRIDWVGGSSYSLDDTSPAGYVQDHWVINPHFALDGGMRLESQRITHTVRYAPRGGFVWSPKENHRIVIRGGAGVFYDSVPLNAYAFSSYPQQLVTSYGQYGNGVPVLFYNLTDQAVKTNLPFVKRSNIAGNFAPYSVAANVEVEREITAALTLKVKYLQSESQGVLTITPQVVKGQNALVLGSNGAAHTRQLEIVSRIGANPARRFFVSYVWQRARGNVNDANSYLGDTPFPVVRTGLLGSLPSEIPNRFLAWGTYKLPFKMMLTPKFEVRNGFPYQSTDVLQNYIAGTPQTPAQLRFPHYLSIDARLSKDIQINKKHAIRLSGAVLNMTNHFNALEVHANTFDPQYGTFFGSNNRKFLIDFDFLY